MKNKNILIGTIIFLITIIILFIFNYLGNFGYYGSSISNAISIVFAGINAYIAYLTASYNKQSSQYQKEAVKESKKRDKSSQASKIYVHTLKDVIEPINSAFIYKLFQPVMIGNSSTSPIYKVFVVSYSNKLNFNKLKSLYKHKDSSDNITKNNYYTYVHILMPGHTFKVIPYKGDASGGEKPSSVIFFTDSLGTKWVRDQQGNLIELSNFNVYKFCNIARTEILMPPWPEFLKNYKTLKSLYNDYHSVYKE